MKRPIIASLLFALVFAVALYIAYSDLRGRAINQGERELAARARRTADTVDRVLQSRMIEAFTLADLPSMRGLAASDEEARAQRTVIAMAELRAIIAADPNVRAASVTDSLGHVILTTDASMNEEWGERPFVREALAGHLFASPPSRDFGEISQYYTAPVLDNATNVAGVLVLRVAVQELWDALKVQPNILVVDDYGVIVADTSPAPHPLESLAPIDPRLQQQLVAEKHYGSQITQIPTANVNDLAMAVRQDAGKTEYSGASGNGVRAAIRKMEVNPWQAVAFESEQMLAAPGQDGLRDLILVGALSGAAAAAAMAIVMSRSALKVA